MKIKLFVFLLFVILPSSAQAVDFSFTDLDGKIYTSADLRGTPLVVNVGAHW